MSPVLIHRPQRAALGSLCGNCCCSDTVLCECSLQQQMLAQQMAVQQQILSLQQQHLQRQGLLSLPATALTSLPQSKSKLGFSHIFSIEFLQVAGETDLTS